MNLKHLQGRLRSVVLSSNIYILPNYIPCCTSAFACPKQCVSGWSDAGAYMGKGDIWAVQSWPKSFSYIFANTLLLEARRPDSIAAYNLINKMC